MRKPFIYTTTAALSLSLLLGACSGNKEAAPPVAKTETPKNESPKPATIKIAQRHLTEDEFKRFILEPVQKKYPHITPQWVDSSKVSLANMVASKDIPDISVDYPLALTQLLDMKVELNMDDVIKSAKFDLNRIRPEFLESIKTAAGVGYLIGLPVYNNSFALFYNKDLFDKMGVPYPKDGMTWDDARTIAAKMTRTEGGAQIWGLYPGEAFRGAYQLGLPFIDFAGKKGALQTDGWKMMFELWASLYQIPGATNLLPSDPSTQATQSFLKGEVGMLAGHSATLQSLKTVKNFNWDVVTYPVNPKAPGTGQRVDSLVFSITNASPNKEAAFQVIETLLSNEVQTDLSRYARVSVLLDDKVHQAFGKDSAEYQSKNVIAMTKPKLAVIQPFKYPFPAESNPAVLVSKAFQEVVTTGKDINTALREADEKLTKAIQALDK
ncbi:extracellular solute-binding protein [Paenibacillus ginsengarvi]|uniref:Extracellular solute-binding protein n=1 Tax=Paenibacillus ginsengarvi TaxID=400777 RepID=A0A3B0BRZ1_9BACL|nr:extracellular solute-binding protein [Paenibacillus ginsengarvi]RKN76053.1 extracellular solute-binding protein [Paenibacillus ginsengarvi]